MWPLAQDHFRLFSPETDDPVGTGTLFPMAHWFLSITQNVDHQPLFYLQNKTASLLAALAVDFFGNDYSLHLPSPFLISNSKYLLLIRGVVRVPHLGGTLHPFT